LGNIYHRTGQRLSRRLNKKNEKVLLPASVRRSASSGCRRGRRRTAPPYRREVVGGELVPVRLHRRSRHTYGVVDHQHVSYSRAQIVAKTTVGPRQAHDDRTTGTNRVGGGERRVALAVGDPHVVPVVM
jgi:hypothetical protein